MGGNRHAWLLALFALFSARMSYSAQTMEAKDTVIAVSEVEVPEGLSSTDEAYVRVSGMFPNTCYSWKEAEIEEVSPFERKIVALARVEQGFCLMVLVPYTQTIPLGRLRPGTYTLHFSNRKNTYLTTELAIRGNY